MENMLKGEISTKSVYISVNKKFRLFLSTLYGID
jgi:hypothetical protein